MHNLQCSNKQKYFSQTAFCDYDSLYQICHILAVEGELLNDKSLTELVTANNKYWQLQEELRVHYVSTTDVM